MSEIYTYIILSISIIFISLIYLTFIYKIKKLIKKKSSIEIDITSKNNALSELNRQIIDLQNDIDKNKDILISLEIDKNNVQEDFNKIKKQFSYAKQITNDLELKEKRLAQINEKVLYLEATEREADIKINDIKSKIDLYERIDDFVDYGFFEEPEYLYDISDKYVSEIKHIRQLQKNLISNDSAVIYDSSLIDNDDKFLFVKETCKKQKKLLIKSFNIECDLLISKVNPGNIERTLNRIVGIANSLESDMADLSMGLNNEYIELKCKECILSYQFKLKKKEEIEEQRQIREQIKEEEKARREYEKEIYEAQKEQELYEKLLKAAKESLNQVTDSEKDDLLLKIKQLEAELSEVKSREERAISMAEQTKKGYVYIISNIGSFGENIYKIGLTRRLDPTERIRELSDASVPFSFDIHAMIVSDDAPALEKSLHRAFNHKRVNAVNIRKEFFEVSLEEIKDKVQEITGKESDFITTILAEEYFQSRRLKGNL